jgi:hypothetical protein
MPVQYPTGILTEHNWTEPAQPFDVSHMGQAFSGLITPLLPRHGKNWFPPISPASSPIQRYSHSSIPRAAFSMI